MSYDKKYGEGQVIRYEAPNTTLTGSNAVVAVAKGPKGKTGRLLDYGIDGITTTTAGATNTPKVEVGTTGTANAYGAAFDVGALTAPNAKSVASTYTRADTTGLVSTNWSTYMTLESLPADTLVCLTMITATGGGAAGVGTPFMLIAWDD